MSPANADITLLVKWVCFISVCQTLRQIGSMSQARRIFRLCGRKGELVHYVHSVCTVLYCGLLGGTPCGLADHNGSLWLEIQKYGARIRAIRIRLPYGLDASHCGCAYTVLQTVHSLIHSPIQSFIHINYFIHSSIHPKFIRLFTTMLHWNDTNDMFQGTFHCRRVSSAYVIRIRKASVYSTIVTCSDGGIYGRLTDTDA